MNDTYSFISTSDSRHIQNAVSLGHSDGLYYWFTEHHQRAVGRDQQDRRGRRGQGEGGAWLCISPNCLLTHDQSCPFSVWQW